MGDFNRLIALRQQGKGRREGRRKGEKKEERQGAESAEEMKLEGLGGNPGLRYGELSSLS